MMMTRPCDPMTFPFKRPTGGDDEFDKHENLEESGPKEMKDD